MLRNKQEQKLKYLRRLDQRMGELGYREVEYVPVEKSYHMGWEVSIDLSESGKRRNDAKDLLEVLDIVGATEPYFTKDVQYIKHLRYGRYNYEKVQKGLLMHTSSKRYPRILAHLPYWHNTLTSFEIRKEKFTQVPMRLRHFFYEADHWKYGCKVYRVNSWKFPKYELVYKVRKAYAGFQGIPKGNEWSEYEQLNDILKNNHYWCSKNGYSRGWNNTKDIIRLRQERRIQKLFCHLMKNSDFSYEAEEETMKYLKNQKRKW
jgi:hypothetical protein